MYGLSNRKECERKYCHNVGYAVYVSRTGRSNYMTIECDQHRHETIDAAWTAFRRGQ